MIGSTLGPRNTVINKVGLDFVGPEVQTIWGAFFKKKYIKLKIGNIGF